jgi:hypothetical protein
VRRTVNAVINSSETLEVDMFALLPVIGGLIAGWLAPRRIAIALQVLFYAVAVTILTITAPDHGGNYGDIVWIAPALAVVSAIALYVGLWLGRRGTSRAAQP